MTPEQINEIVAKLEGTQDSGQVYADMYSIDLSEIVAQLSMKGYERCCDCDYWYAHEELYTTEDGQKCSSCCTEEEKESE